MQHSGAAARAAQTGLTPPPAPPPPQGASPQELRQKVNAAAVPDAVSDDPEGYGTWDPAARPSSVDISITPNRLLYSKLASQARAPQGDCLHGGLQGNGMLACWHGESVMPHRPGVPTLVCACRPRRRRC